MFICLQKTVYGASVIIFEGIMSFADKELLKVNIIKYFIIWLFLVFLHLNDLSDLCFSC